MIVPHYVQRSIFEPFKGAVSGNLPPGFWTGVGFLAVPLWATWPTLAYFASEMPVFQVISIAFAVAASLLWLIERPGVSKGSRTQASVIPSLACALGLLGANALFILSIKYIPAAQANLLSYLWPVMVIAMGAALRLFAFRIWHGLSLIAGFSGVIIVSGGSDVVFSQIGIGLALASGLSWALFTVFRVWQGPDAKPVLMTGCALSAALSLILHLSTEEFLVPESTTLGAAIAVGVFPVALANLCWDVGVRKGDSRVLATMAYSTPAAGLFVLSLFGLTALDSSLLLGAALVILAGIIASKT